MTYRSHKIAPNRYFDHLYDPLFTTSSWRDVARKSMISLRRSAPVQIYPVYQNMFTELTYEARNQYTLLRNPVPYSEFPVHGEPTSSVTGGDRAKFFANPITNVQTINVHLAEPIPLEEMSPQHVTRGCQTMYRESSAQTVPWMPTAVVSGDQTPEIVQVSAMIEGYAYPGLKEIEIIERARWKRDYEDALPLPETPEEVAKRDVVNEGFEWDTWLQREAEIENCQQMRYEMVMEMIKDREERNKEYMETKLERSCRRIQRERDEQLEKLRQSHQRKLRKLEKKHKTVTKVPRKDTDLSDYIETITVPLPPKRRVSPTMSKFESNYLAKTEYKPVANVKKYLSNREPLWKPKEEVKETQRGLWSDKVLGELYESLKHFRTMNEAPQQASCTVVVSSPTDSETSLHGPPETCVIEEEYQDAVLIQKYVKGRAIQNLVWRGREQCNELIDELQSSQRIIAVRELFEEKTIEVQSIEQEQELGELQPYPVIRPSCHIMLEFLSKEIERLQDERKQQARQLLEDRERMRSDARKEEEVYRNIFKAEHDIITTYLENVLMEGITVISEEEAREHITTISESPKVAQVLKYQIIPEILIQIPTSSFDLISDILNDFLSYDMMRRLETQELDTLDQTTTFMNEFVVPELLNRAAKHNVWTDTQKEDMHVASELIQEFVAPEIFKILAREKQKRSRQAHLLAAHDAIWQAIEEMPEQPAEQQKGVSKTCSMDSMTEAEQEAHHVVDDCIYRALKMIQGSESDNEVEEKGQLELQKALLNRIVNNLNEKLRRQIEAEQRGSSVDIYLTSNEGMMQEPDDEE